jgi:hypothetical protein
VHGLGRLPQPDGTWQLEIALALPSSRALLGDRSAETSLLLICLGHLAHAAWVHLCDLIHRPASTPPAFPLHQAARSLVEAIHVHFMSLRHRPEPMRERWLRAIARFVDTTEPKWRIRPELLRG